MSKVTGNTARLIIKALNFIIKRKQISNVSCFVCVGVLDMMTCCPEQSSRPLISMRWLSVSNSLTVWCCWVAWVSLRAITRDAERSGTRRGRGPDDGSATCIFSSLHWQPASIYRHGAPGVSGANKPPSGCRGQSAWRWMLCQRWWEPSKYFIYLFT